MNVTDKDPTQAVALSWVADDIEARNQALDDVEVTEAALVESIAAALRTGLSWSRIAKAANVSPRWIHQWYKRKTKS